MLTLFWSLVPWTSKNRPISNLWNKLICFHVCFEFHMCVKQIIEFEIFKFICYSIKDCYFKKTVFFKKVVFDSSDCKQWLQHPWQGNWSSCVRRQLPILNSRSFRSLNRGQTSSVSSSAASSWPCWPRMPSPNCATPVQPLPSSRTQFSREIRYSDAYLIFSTV